ncbi:MAG: 16S rRNA (guanine(966)-N(2))-methyltransferase RsmD [Magnetococcales bacterium]|nr:16S rRNA (guanine(966)-N(2))-methyltransferase RsmD [Magnetococcales bacterium]
MVRISGGLFRGRLLHLPNDGWIRPTMGRVRESLFSMLARHVIGATSLDLFAGCGLLGLEALSRGAQTTFFVDIERKAVQSIEKNVTLCGVHGHSVILQGDALHPHTLDQITAWTTQRADGHQPFNLVFLDPPYRRGLVTSAVQRLAQSTLLAPGAIIVAEQEAETEPEASSPWQLLQNRRYGDTRIIFWQTPP